MGKSLAFVLLLCPCIWACDTWQARVKMSSEPWKSPRRFFNGKETMSEQMAKNIHALQESVLDAFQGSKEGSLQLAWKQYNTDPGLCRQWKDWVSAQKKCWDISTSIDECLEAQGFDLGALVRYGKKRELLSSSISALSQHNSAILQHLLGDEPSGAYLPGCGWIPEALFFAEFLLKELTYPKLKGRIDRRVKKAEKELELLDRYWLEVQKGKAHPFQSTSAWIKQARLCKDLISFFDTPADARRQLEIDSDLEQVKNVYMSDGDVSKIETKISSRHRQSMKSFASPELLSKVRAELNSFVSTELHPCSFTEEYVELPQLGEDVNPHYRDFTAEELYESMGLKGHGIPGMANIRDKSRVYTLWDDTPEAQAFWSSNTNYNEKESVKYPWHQVVGIHKGVGQMIMEEPYFLFDAVGVGKTPQATGIFLMRSFIAEYYAQNKCYPPAWAKLKNSDRPIKDGVTVIVAPLTLIPQWERELRTFVCPGFIDIEVCLGSYANRKSSNFWSGAFNGSGHRLSSRVILISQPALTSDAKHALTAKGNLTINQEKLQNTIFHQTIGTLVVDEVHTYRNTNKASQALRQLSAQAAFTCMLTATPIVTHPRDGYQLAYLAGIHIDPTLPLTMRKALAKAKRDDKKDEEEWLGSESPEGIKQELMAGKQSERGMKHYRLACLDFIAILRPFFLENSVRRTLKSRDNRGHPIWEIRDPLDVVMHLEPTKMEKEVTSEMAKNASEARDTGAKFKHTFYLDARNSTLHVCFTDHILRDFHIPMRLEQYRDLPSTKIDTMIHIISWHRKQPGLPPLRVENANCRNYFVIDLVTSMTTPKRRSSSIPPGWNSPGEHVLGSTELQDGPQRVNEPPESVRRGRLCSRGTVQLADAAGKPEAPWPRRLRRSESTLGLCYKMPTMDDMKRPPPDKVIIYSAFPVHNKYLCKILGFFDVHPFEIDGTKTLRERAEELARFRESPNFEVLFVSSVGTTGLNLECANILIILDVLWSKQDDTQLIGRLQRRGQTKLVIVYRLLIKDSPDVFLNDISFNKSIMHDTFMANETGWKKMLMENTHPDSDSDDEGQGGVSMHPKHACPKTPRDQARKRKAGEESRNRSSKRSKNSSKSHSLKCSTSLSNITPSQAPSAAEISSYYSPPTRPEFSHNNGIQHERGPLPTAPEPGSSVPLNRIQSPPSSSPGCVESISDSSSLVPVANVTVKSVVTGLMGITYTEDDFPDLIAPPMPAESGAIPMTAETCPISASFDPEDKHDQLRNSNAWDVLSASVGAGGLGIPEILEKLASALGETPDKHWNSIIDGLMMEDDQLEDAEMVHEVNRRLSSLRACHIPLPPDQSSSSIPCINPQLLVKSSAPPLKRARASSSVSSSSACVSSGLQDTSSPRCEIESPLRSKLPTKNSTSTRALTQQRRSQQEGSSKKSGLTIKASNDITLQGESIVGLLRVGSMPLDTRLARSRGVKKSRNS